jgi:hypothetical protein
MKCPNCGLINPDTAQRCDCGYDFTTETIKIPYDAQVIPEWPKLPVSESTYEVYLALFSFIKSNVRASLATFAILYFLTEGIRYGFSLAEVTRDLGTLSGRPVFFIGAVLAIGIIFVFLSLLIIVPLLISAHRFWLLGEENAARFFTKLTDPRERKYLYHTGLYVSIFLIPFSLIMLSIFIRVPGALVIFFFLLLPIAIFFPIRLLLVFPAIALDEATSFRFSWDLTIGMTWRIWFVNFLTFFPLSFIFSLSPGNIPIISSGVSVFYILVESLLAAAVSTIVYDFVRKMPIYNARLENREALRNRLEG